MGRDKSCPIQLKSKMERFPPRENPQAVQRKVNWELGKNTVEESIKNGTVERNILFVSVISTVKQEVIKRKAKNGGRSCIMLRTLNFIL